MRLRITALLMAAVALSAEQIPSVRIDTPFSDPPAWALLERQLIDLMNRTPEVLLQKYVRPNGEIKWPPREEGFQSIDALDDAYESFHNWPLFYAVGGHEKFLKYAKAEFEAITNQFSRYSTGKGYPMVVKEYQPGYDWFHQGEGNYLFYMLSMADPDDERTRERARRFAGLFMNEDPDAMNYDPANKIIRCSHNGSKGPAFWNFDGAPVWTLDGYGLPFYDVPGCRTVADLKDREVRRRMGKIASERRGKGDAVVNLGATTLAANAYLLTGEEKYKNWVMEYTGAWVERARVNGGIVPDNVGLSGKIGEHIDGKWWGANYGWVWPHGWESIGQAVFIAAQNASLVAGDRRYLAFLRNQMDILAGQGITEEGTLYVPHKYGDRGLVNYKPWTFLQILRNPDQTALQRDGWFEFLPMDPMFPAHLWNMSLSPDDLDRSRKLRNQQRKEHAVISKRYRKDQGGNEGAWLAYMQGELPDYPEQIMRHAIAQVYGRLAMMRSDTEDPLKYGDAYLQSRNPVNCEGLVQLTTGAPLPIYNGGLLVAQVRHFDPARRRPGLPPDVAALVSSVAEDFVALTLLNLSVDEERDLIVQAGAAGEHEFTDLLMESREKGKPVKSTVKVGGRFVRVSLAPGAGSTLRLGIKRFARQPTYTLPWNQN